MCTEIFLPFEGSNPTMISGRNMDVTTEMEGTFLVMKDPVGQENKAILVPPGKKPVTWKNKYGFVGIGKITKTSFGDLKVYNEGLNTRGLSCAGLWLTYTKYDGDICDGCKDEYLDADNISSYVLGNCATTDEARDALNDINIWLPPPMEIMMPGHFAIHDNKGNSLVLEFINGKKMFYNNDIGVLANGPAFDWQAINLNYFYNSLTSNDNDINKYVEATKNNETGQYDITWGNGFQYEVLGAGMSGLPGSSTSPARFVRAAKLRNCVPATTSDDRKNGVQYALQVLGRLASTDKEIKLYFKTNGEPYGQDGPYNATLWRAVRDHTNLMYYYCTNLNHNIQGINLNVLDFEDGKFCTSSLDNDNWYNDSTQRLVSYAGLPS